MTTYVFTLRIHSHCHSSSYHTYSCLVLIHYKWKQLMIDLVMVPPHAYSSEFETLAVKVRHQKAEKRALEGGVVLVWLEAKIVMDLEPSQLKVVIDAETSTLNSASKPELITV